MATERDWVRVVREQRCEECGLDAASLPRSELPDGIADAAASWSSLLQHSPVEQLRARPDGVAWSALEYGGHVLGVLEVFRGRVDRMLVEDDPDLGWWDHEAAVTDEAYQQMEPRALGDAIVSSADALGGRVRGLADAQWSRAGVRRAGEQFTVEGLVRFALHELVHHLHDAGELVAAALSASLRPADEPGGLRAAPTVPADVSAFSSNTLFGQPGIYPDGPPMTPAAGQPLDDDGARAVLVDLLDAPHAAQALDRFEDRELRHRVPDAQVRAALLLLAGGPAAPELDAFLAGTTHVLRLGRGPTDGPGRVVGDEQGDDDPARRVVNERYAAEHPAVVAPSLAHALCHHGDLASSAEEATLHGLLAAVHTWLLSVSPSLGLLRTELARRQASLTITLLNARAPGSDRASIRCPDGPGTIPGGNPALQCPDLWSIPFTSRRPQDCDLFVPHPVRESLSRLAAGTAPPPPDRYDEPLGAWCTEHLGRGAWFGPAVRELACRSLGLFGPGPFDDVQSS